MRIVRQLLGLPSVDRLMDIAHEQQALILDYQRELGRQKLEYVRSTRDLIGQFLYALENDVEVAEELRKGHSDLADEVARLEEHSR